MSTALGLMEFKTIPMGVAATDDMLKAAEVELIMATPICPGKYVTIFSGEVANVTTSIERGLVTGGIFVIDSHIIPNVTPKILPALTGSTLIEGLESLGAIETIAAIGAIIAGDIVAKSGQVELIEIRLARGLGGKGEVYYTGELGSVEAATKTALERLGADGGIVSSVVIPRPHKDLMRAIIGG